MSLKPALNKESGGKALALYRRRYIPEEIIHLKDDEILYESPEHIVTRWQILNPRTDFSGGVSCYFINMGIKVSRIYDEYQNTLYIYCDIIDTVYDPDENSYVFTDLLVDVVFRDGSMQVLDVAELADAYEEGLISIEVLLHAIRRADYLLTICNEGRFGELLDVLDGKVSQHG